MAELVVKITSKDMIRPSSPTPNHLKTLEFSFQDQLSPFIHMPLIFFYQSYGANYSDTIALLKESLSQTLVQFYPLAGRVKELWIDCNDEGVAFYEANVCATLAQAIGNQNNYEELVSLVPFSPFSVNSNRKVVAGIQVNRFLCGGVAIGNSVSHKAQDAATYCAFLSAWAGKARGYSIAFYEPEGKFVGTSLFPQIKMDVVNPTKNDSSKEKIVTKIVQINKETIEMLKRRSVDRVQGQAPTTVEALTAFFWKQFIRVAKTKPTPIKVSAALQAVNLRGVESSPIPKNCYGNVYAGTIASTRVDTAIVDYPEAVEKLREAVIGTRNSSYYSEVMRTGKYVSEKNEAYANIAKQGGFCFFSDLSKFPFYEVDFGFGKPLWVAQTPLPFKNMVNFFSTRCGEGIEAWIYMLEQDVAAFEQDQEFRSLTPLNVLAKL